MVFVTFEFFFKIPLFKFAQKITTCKPPLYDHFGFLVPKVAYFTRDDDGSVKLFSGDQSGSIATH